MERLRPNGDRKIDQLAAGAQAHQYSEGQAGNSPLPQFRKQAPRSDMGLEKGIEQDMEVGYEDSPSPLTLEALEKKFHDETMRLAKEESDADEAENARHREKKIEISKLYHEKLSALRGLQAKMREEFLHKETQERLNQHRQQQISNNYPMDRGMVDPRGYRPHPIDSTAGVDPRGYAPRHYSADPSAMDPRFYGQNHYPAGPHGYGRPASIESPPLRGYGTQEHYRERDRSPPPYSHQVQRSQPEAEGRVPIPQGRSYNNTRARNF